MQYLLLICISQGIAEHILILSVFLPVLLKTTLVKWTSVKWKAGRVGNITKRIMQIERGIAISVRRAVLVLIQAFLVCNYALKENNLGMIMCKSVNTEKEYEIEKETELERSTYLWASL